MKYSTLLPLSCDGCVHMRPEQGYLICNYAFDMDECRRCDPKDCDKYSDDLRLLPATEAAVIRKYKKNCWERRQINAHTD